MEILFCDLCNESVPEAALHDGSAYYRKGRLICPACDQAMGGGGGGEEGARGARPRGESGRRRPEVERAPGRGGSGGVFVALLVLAFSGAGLWLLREELDDLRGEISTARTDLSHQVAVVRALVREDEAALPALLDERDQRSRAESEARAAEILRGLDELRADLMTAEGRTAQGAEELADLRARFDEEQAAMGDRLEGMREKLAAIEKGQSFLSDRLVELEETLRAVTARGPIPAGIPSPEGGGAKPWAGLVEDLKHANAGIRLDAVYALGETGDRDVVPHLIPMLGDVDLFVRMATARMLEDLGAHSAVPSLIDALEDNQSAVREAAMVALRKITGKSMGFEPTAGVGERTKRVKAWRDWWAKNGEAFLAGE